MLGACQRKASCWGEGGGGRVFSHKDGIAFKETVGDIGYCDEDVDFAKARLLNKKIFVQMLSGFVSEYTHLLYHSEFGKRNF
jgi:hypothetical protein